MGRNAFPVGAGRDGYEVRKEKAIAMYCEQCQSEYPEGRKFCPRCGVLLRVRVPAVLDPPMECPVCGKALEPTRKFCIYCGARLQLEPRPCPACRTLAPAQAVFCGECGTPLSESSTNALELPETPAEGGVSSAESPTVPFPFSDRDEGNSSTPYDYAAEAPSSTEGKDEGEQRWFHIPVVRITFTITFLSLFGFFVYHFGKVQQTSNEQGSTPPSGEISTVPSASTISTPPQGVASPSPSKEEKTAMPPDLGGAKPDEPKPEVSPPMEEPLSPPRFYSVVKTTVVRDNPSRAGKEVAQIEPETSIYVVARVGDWLKIESKSTPPKPPGYVWKEDAVPE